MYDAGLLVAVLIPIGIFLVVYSIAYELRPSSAGFTTAELTIQWLVAIAALAWYGSWRIYRLVVRGQSVGMRRTGIEIVRWPTGGRISYTSALVTTVLPPLTGVLGLVPAMVTGADSAAWGVFLWLVYPLSALWNRTGRGWHDRLARAVVVAQAISNPLTARSRLKGRGLSARRGF
ncbi:MAG: RDD family protein [Acidimicrobiaceae bacterium]|nr:RDD family protein [Acidimicrobiaceae bacterium]